MIKKNHAIPLLLILGGYMLTMDVSPWTVGGAIAAGVGAIFLLGQFIYHEVLTWRPFKFEYSLIAGARGDYKSYEIIQGTAPEGILEWHGSKDKIIIPSDVEYTIFLELKPRKSCSITGADLRFIKEGGNQPNVSLLQDISPQSCGIKKPSSMAAQGRSLYYETELYANRGGKAIDYLATFKTYSSWKGKLSLRISIAGQRVCYIRVPCEVSIKDEYAE